MPGSPNTFANANASPERRKEHTLNIWLHILLAQLPGPLGARRVHGVRLASQQNVLTLRRICNSVTDGLEQLCLARIRNQETEGESRVGFVWHPAHIRTQVRA